VPGINVQWHPLCMFVYMHHRYHVLQLWGWNGLMKRQLKRSYILRWSNILKDFSLWLPKLLNMPHASRWNNMLCFLWNASFLWLPKLLKHNTCTYLGYHTYWNTLAITKYRKTHNTDLVSILKNYPQNVARKCSVLFVYVGLGMTSRKGDKPGHGQLNWWCLEALNNHYRNNTSALKTLPHFVLLLLIFVWWRVHNVTQAAEIMFLLSDEVHCRTLYRLQEHAH